MAGHIGEGLLRNAKQHRAPGGIQLFHPRKNLQVNGNARPFGKEPGKRMQRGNQAQIIQHCGTQFAGEFMHDVYRFFHEALRTGNITI